MTAKLLAAIEAVQNELAKGRCVSDGGEGMSSYGGEHLPLADYDCAISFLRDNGKGSGVMRCLRDSRGRENKRWHCLCTNSCNFNTATYRITKETFQQLKPVLTGNTYVGYNRWFVYDYIPEDTMTTEAKSSPFVPAVWGESYNLGGATWTPSLEPGLCMIVPATGFIFNGDGGYINQHVHPLLPSPAWINAQANPRAVAIAALERAGFERDWHPTDTQWLHIDVGELAYLYVLYEYLDGSGPRIPAHVCIGMDEVADPAIARYAVDCFGVLHKWAAQINWEAQP